jgi:hypothetical protein
MKQEATKVAAKVVDTVSDAAKKAWDWLKKK